MKFPVNVIARKATHMEWKTFHVEIKAKSEHKARRAALLDFIDKGFQVKETSVEYAY